MIDLGLVAPFHSLRVGVSNTQLPLLLVFCTLRFAYVFNVKTKWLRLRSQFLGACIPDNLHTVARVARCGKKAE
jgi:hypothetical protein